MAFWSKKPKKSDWDIFKDLLAATSQVARNSEIRRSLWGDNFERLKEALLDAEQIDRLEKRWGAEAEGMLQKIREKDIEENHAKHVRELDKTAQIISDFERLGLEYEADHYSQLLHRNPKETEHLLRIWLREKKIRWEMTTKKQYGS